MTYTPEISRPASLSVANRVGLVLAGLLGLVDVASLATPTPAGQTGPPFGVLIFGAVLGVVTLAGAVSTWVTRRWTWARVTAGSRVISALLAVPAFFVEGVPAVLVAAAAVGVALTALTVFLILKRPSA